MQTYLLELLVIFIICEIAVSVFKNATLGQLDLVYPPAAVLQKVADKSNEVSDNKTIPT